MPWAYSENRKSPVDAIMDAAARLGMKVFMSIGWAKDQDDNLRDPVIQQRQLDMMKELASIYRTHKGFMDGIYRLRIACVLYFLSML